MTVNIIGGGMTGATLALALSKLTQRRILINLVEAIIPDQCIHHSLGARSIAIAHGTICELKSIGIWSALASCATAITYVEVSNSSYFGKIGIAAENYHLPALGYVIQLSDARQILFNLLREEPGIRLYSPAILQHINRNDTHSIVTLDTGQQLSAELMVAADGTSSQLAILCGIRWRKKDYQQIAVIADIRTMLHHRGYAFERFTLQGSLALLPMPEGQSSLIWCLPAINQQEISSWNDKQFCRILQKQFGWRLGRIISVGERQYYHLQLRIAERHIAHRLALIGNAAQTLHPITGQGFNLGLRDVMTLAEILVHAVVQGDDIGDYTVLARYQQRRLQDQTKTVSMTDMFANYHTLPVIVRNLGLLTIAHIPLLRDIIVRQILGWVAR
ncbi:2-octaprenyl-6-methoxyphenyl hydroxylase [Candidatus Palibaumannia cicadellinicola]|nr:2-octaprenyl-6-methoxyphenyl hydroxylase [Candidatus Baumannia cicadellinicola]